MYVRFTPKQLIVLKKILPSCSLRASDIQIFQEIQSALDNPIENEGESEKNYNNYKKKERVKKNNTYGFKTFSADKTKDEKPKEVVKEEKPNSSQLDKEKEEKPSEEIKENMETQKESDNSEEIESEIEDKKNINNLDFNEKINYSNYDDDSTPTLDELDNAGPFGEIDRRKSKTNDYL